MPSICLARAAFLCALMNLSSPPITSGTRLCLPLRQAQVNSLHRPSFLFLTHQQPKKPVLNLLTVFFRRLTALICPFLPHPVYCPPPTPMQSHNKLRSPMAPIATSSLGSFDDSDETEMLIEFIHYYEYVVKGITVNWDQMSEVRRPAGNVSPEHKSILKISLIDNCYY